MVRENIDKVIDYCESKYIESPEGTLHKNCYTTKEACILSSKLNLNGLSAQYVENNEVKQMYVSGNLAITFVD